ncbi:MAG: hypothetical protein ACOC44_10045 [Promethearchaeia archaeon]
MTYSGGYYFGILELLDELEITEPEQNEYHGKELFDKFEKKFGSGNRINFNRALKQLTKAKKIKSRPAGEKNRILYSLNRKAKH